VSLGNRKQDASAVNASAINSQDSRARESDDQRDVSVGTDGELSVLPAGNQQSVSLSSDGRLSDELLEPRTRSCSLTVTNYTGCTFGGNEGCFNDLWTTELSNPLNSCNHSTINESDLADWKRRDSELEDVEFTECSGTPTGVASKRYDNNDCWSQASEFPWEGQPLTCQGICIVDYSYTVEY